MRTVTIGLLGTALTLSACSGASDEASYNGGKFAGAEAADAVEEAAEVPQSDFGFKEATEGNAGGVIAPASTINVKESVESDPTGNAIAVSTPQIAYVYDFGFRIGVDAIAPLQQRHANLCEKKGPGVCRIISMEQSGSEGSYGYGQLELAVAASQARAFGAELTNSAEEMDGEQVSLSIGGEDLSKKIVDTEARLRARTLLRDRLMDILRSRSGTVAELVEAERGVAQVNEEIDQARSWLAEMQGRVAFSTVRIEYNSGSRRSGGFTGPIISALSSIGSILGMVVAAIIVGVTILLPLTMLFFGIRWLWRRFGSPFKRNRTEMRMHETAEKAGAD